MEPIGAVAIDIDDIAIVEKREQPEIELVVVGSTKT